MNTKKLLPSIICIICTHATATNSIYLSTINNNKDNNGLSHPYRLDIAITDSQLNKSEKPIIEKTLKLNNKNRYTNYLIANNFFATIPTNIMLFDYQIINSIQMKGHNRFSIRVKSDNTEKELTYSFEFTEIDISNIDVNNKNYRFFQGNFELNKSAFPKGSLCIVNSKSYPNFDIFRFTSKDWLLMPNSHSIEEGLSGYQNYGFSNKDDKASKNFDLTKFIDLHIIHVGENNEYRVAYFKNNINDNFYKVMVEYNNHLYNANYIQQQGINNNTDPKKGVVYCDFLNSTATNYLESEIKKYGTLKTKSLDSF